MNVERGNSTSISHSEVSITLSNCNVKSGCLKDKFRFFQVCLITIDICHVHVEHARDILVDEILVDVIISPVHMGCEKILHNASTM